VGDNRIKDLAKEAWNKVEKMEKTGYGSEQSKLKKWIHNTWQ